jgi:hypothetical protein
MFYVLKMLVHMPFAVMIVITSLRAWLNNEVATPRMNTIEQYVEAWEQSRQHESPLITAWRKYIENRWQPR